MTLEIHWSSGRHANVHLAELIPKYGLELENFVSELVQISEPIFPSDSIPHTDSVI